MHGQLQSKLRANLKIQELNTLQGKAQQQSIGLSAEQASLQI